MALSRSRWTAAALAGLAAGVLLPHRAHATPSTGASDWMWTAQLDVDLDLRASR